jgi:hypothetical protein
MRRSGPDTSHRVRPLVGVGVGTFVLPRTLGCEPIACESLPPFLVASREARYHFDVVLPIVGPAVQATPRIVVRGGWQPHNIGGEELEHRVVHRRPLAIQPLGDQAHP